MRGWTHMCRRQGLRWTRAHHGTRVLQLRTDLDQSQPHLQPGLQGRTQHASQALQGLEAEVSQSVPGPAGEPSASGQLTDLGAQTPCGSESTCGACVVHSSVVYCVCSAHTCVYPGAPAHLSRRALLARCGGQGLGGRWLQSLGAPGHPPGWAQRTPALPSLQLPLRSPSHTQGSEGLRGELVGPPWREDGVSLHVSG